MKTPTSLRLFKLVCLLVLVSLACNLPILAPSITGSPTNPAQLPATYLPPSGEPTAIPTPEYQPTPPPGIHGHSFAAYPLISVNMPDAFQGGYTLPVDLSKVQGLDTIKLSTGQKGLLAQNGFVVTPPVPGEFREFYQLYESQRYDADPTFVTTDGVLHIYHLIFDKMLRDLERDYFIPTLSSLTTTLLQASQSQYAALKGTALEEPARRNVAYFAVASQLLGLPDPIPAGVEDLVLPELNNIQAHGGVAFSPIWDRPDLPEDEKLAEDYSQYIPRGHYTRSEELSRYFKAMMWYGRLTFRLKDPFETRRALLLTQALRTTKAQDGTPAADLWANIYDPTTFIVGKADDLSFQEYGTLSDLNFGANPDPTVFADDALLAKFTAAAKLLPPPQVNSMWVWIWQDKQTATTGFRVMGQRFTLDEYVFGQLIWRSVGTEAKPRGLPKALDFTAALGSEEALGILKDLGDTAYDKYPEQMTKVRAEIAALQQDSWTQNIYWSWLYTFQPLIGSKDARFPAFMRTHAWERKDLNTVLGSFTELKHDTILYSKQVMAEMGGGGPEQPPHGYVEPNPEMYTRLLALAQMTYNGLEQRNLLVGKDGRTKNNLENIIDLLTFLKRMSEAELAGTPITDQDYWRIQYFGGELESMTIAASDCDSTGNCRDLQDQKSMLVADIATGLDANGSLVALEEGSGQPTKIYVVLPDKPYRIGIGAVYTYYEFPVPVNERMTDEQWQSLVAGKNAPPLPGWTASFISK